MSSFSAPLRQVRLNAAVTVACAAAVGVFTARVIAICADCSRVRAWRWSAPFRVWHAVAGSSRVIA
jgi:hypothetical protein